MARCGKSTMIFRRNRKIANCNEFRLGHEHEVRTGVSNSAAMSYTRCCE